LPKKGASQRPATESLIGAAEFAEGMWQACIGMSKANVEAQFGIPSQMVKRRKREIRESFGIQEITISTLPDFCMLHEKVVKSTIASKFSLRKRGPKPVLDDVEAHVIGMYANQLDQTGNGLDRNRLVSMARKRGRILWTILIPSR
jgi:hypothetical protein